jgi:hypothetical protein
MAAELLQACGVCLPMVGIVQTFSPNFNLYSILVFPAASRPSCKSKHAATSSSAAIGKAVHALERGGQHCGEQCKSSNALGRGTPALVYCFCCLCCLYVQVSRRGEVAGQLASCSQAYHKNSELLVVEQQLHQELGESHAHFYVRC